MAKPSFSFPFSEIDPIPEGKTYQSRGTITFLSTRDLVPMVFGTDIINPSGLGRWGGQTFRGKDNHFLSIITGYRVCTGSIASSSIGSTFSREYEHHRSQGKQPPSTKTLPDRSQRNHPSPSIQRMRNRSHDGLQWTTRRRPRHPTILGKRATSMTFTPPIQHHPPSSAMTQDVSTTCLDAP